MVIVGMDSITADRERGLSNYIDKRLTIKGASTWSIDIQEIAGNSPVKLRRTALIRGQFYRDLLGVKH